MRLDISVPSIGKHHQFHQQIVHRINCRLCKEWVVMIINRKIQVTHDHFRGAGMNTVPDARWNPNIMPGGQEIGLLRRIQVNNASLGIKELAFFVDVFRNEFFTHNRVMAVNSVRISVYFGNIVSVYILLYSRTTGETRSPEFRAKLNKTTN